MTSLATATITLYFVMNPLGIIPVFLSLLSTIPDKRRGFIIIREALIAFIILTMFLFFGQEILDLLSISETALKISGGIMLFLIALPMIFPNPDRNQHERQIGEPFIVPIAIPLLAGPSAMATVILFASKNETQLSHAFLAIVMTCIAVTITLLLGTLLRRLLGQRGLIALERLMGMILTAIAVQMLLSGIQYFFHLG